MWVHSKPGPYSGLIVSRLCIWWFWSEMFGFLFLFIRGNVCEELWKAVRLSSNRMSIRVDLTYQVLGVKSFRWSPWKLPLYFIINYLVLTLSVFHARHWNTQNIKSFTNFENRTRPRLFLLPRRTVSILCTPLPMSEIQPHKSNLKSANDKMLRFGISLSRFYHLHASFQKPVQLKGFSLHMNSYGSR